MRIKNYSKHDIYWKLASVFFCLFLFFGTWQTAVFANEITENIISNVDKASTSEEIIQKIITKNTTDSELQLIVDFYKEMNIKVIFSKVKRNRNNDIIKIKALVYFKGSKMEWDMQNNRVIEAFSIQAILKKGEVDGIAFGTPDEETVRQYEAGNVIEVVKAEKIHVNSKGLNEKSIQTIILQKNDETAEENKTGAEIIKDLVKNSSVDFDKALLFLNGSRINQEALSVIKNQEGLTIILSDAKEALTKFGSEGNHGVIEIFQENEIDLAENQKNVQAAMRMMQEAKKDLNTEETRTQQLQVQTETSYGQITQTNGKLMKDRMSIVQESTKERVASQLEDENEKIEMVNGKEVKTRTISSKNGIVIKNMTSNNELEAYKSVLAADKIVLNFADVERNKFGIITGIRISLKSNNEEFIEVWETKDYEKGIPDIFAGRINGKLNASNNLK
uniref:hypothetical protein n=1 Tax=Flavobacterium sp. TaxID=239 RepID=UPI004049F373